MNANAMRRGVTLLALLVAGSVRAELPRYDFQLQARTNLLGNDSGAYNVAPGNLLGGSYTLPITSDRRVAFTLSITPEQRRGLWYGVEGKGSRVYLLPDLGQARVDQETPSSPVFGGSPSINARGDITFAPGLAPPDNDQEEWGTAVYVAQAQTDGSDAGVDAGTEPDAGGGTDGGGADAGTEPDAGGGLDGGAADAGTEPDAGGEVDGGGCDPDAGGVGCEPDGGGDGDGGDTVDSGTEPGTDDAGTQPDGGSRPDAGPTDGGTFDPLPGDGDDGCGCQSTSPAALWPWALVGLVGLARRRARSGGPLSSSGTDAPDAARPGSMWS